MNPYYRSLLKELEQMIQEGKYQEVFNLAKEELELRSEERRVGKECG